MSTNAQQTGELLAQPQPTSAIVEYTQTEKALADLRGRLKSVLFDVTTTAGDKAARAARKECVTLRTSLEDKRLELNAKDQERIRGRNLEAKRITAEIEALEEPIDSQIKAEEKRKEDERKAKAEIERQRVAAIQARIDEIRQRPADAVGQSVAEIELYVKSLVELQIDDTFAELKQQAEGAKATSLIRLRATLAKAQAMEAEQARLAAERIENERIRQENEAAAKVERERLADAQRVAREELERERLRQQAAADVERARIAEEERVAKAARDAEAAQQAEEARRRQAAIDAENERIRRENEAAAAAERQRIADENAALQARRDAQVAEELRLAQGREAREIEQAAEARRIATEREQLLRDQEALKAEREKPAPVYGEAAGTFADTASSFQPVDESVAESASVAQASVPESSVTPDVEPMLASIELKVYLAMESVCKAAKEWAAFQDPDSKADQKTDRKLAARAREAVSYLLSAVQLLP